MLGEPNRCGTRARMSYEAAGFEVIDLASGDRTVDLARQLKPEVILLSASPGEDSLSVVVRLKADATTRKITVVALVDPHTSDRDEAALYDAGIESSLRTRRRVY